MALEDRLEIWFERLCICALLGTTAAVCSLPQATALLVWTSLPPWLRDGLYGVGNVLAFVVIGSIASRWFWLDREEPWETRLDAWIAGSALPVAFKRFWLRIDDWKWPRGDKTRDVWRGEATRSRANVWLCSAIIAPYAVSFFAEATIDHVRLQSVLTAEALFLCATFIASFAYVAWWFLHSSQTLIATWVGRYLSLFGVVMASGGHPGALWHNLLKIVADRLLLVGSDDGLVAHGFRAAGNSLQDFQTHAWDPNGEIVLWWLVAYTVLCVSRNWIGRSAFGAKMDRKYPSTLRFKQARAAWSFGLCNGMRLIVDLEDLYEADCRRYPRVIADVRSVLRTLGSLPIAYRASVSDPARQEDHRAAKEA